MRIAVDVDGVLADRIGSIVDRIDETYGVALEPSDIDEYDFSIPGVDAEIHEVIEASTWDPAHLRGLAPVEGAIDGMQTLQERHELVIATHRPRRIHGQTERWLDAHDVPYDEFVDECGRRKCDFDAALLVDDRPANVRAFTRRRGEGVLFCQPWNAEFTPGASGNAVEDWNDLLKHVEGSLATERE